MTDRAAAPPVAVPAAVILDELAARLGLLIAWDDEARLFTFDEVAVLHRARAAATAALARLR